MSWKLDLGANVEPNGTTTFKVWAPNQKKLDLRLHEKNLPMKKDPDGYFQITVSDAHYGDRYTYLLDGKIERPDPASRFQPEGVHGPSEIVDPSNYQWSDAEWRGIPLRDIIFYECHVGTFTEEGTFESMIEKLPYLKELGINCIEIMPIVQFPGKWNWGYDGVNLYAPQNTYGGPEKLKKLVDACHSHGIALCLDVVYNHLGPEGNRLDEFGPYFSERYSTQWGRTFNFDGPYCDFVRHYIIQNALYWIEEYHIDALRLDAIHGIFDFSTPTFIEELSNCVEQQGKHFGRDIHVIAETDLNDARFVRSQEKGGYGISAQWSDDFHHSLHVALTHEIEKHYVDFNGIPDLTKAFRRGFVYEGEYSTFRKRKHGTDASDLPFEKFIVFLQNHDQIGNRVEGKRLSSQISFPAQKMCAALLLLSPYQPLLFMGQEYGETAPFQYFVDYDNKELTKEVYRAKMEEYDGIEELGYPAEEAFKNSHLHWDTQTPEHKALLSLYRTLISLRKSHPCFRSLKRKDIKVYSSSENQWIAWEMSPPYSPSLRILCHLGKKPLSLPNPFVKKGNWDLTLHTEQTPYTSEEQAVKLANPTWTIPPESAVVLTSN